MRAMVVAGLICVAGATGAGEGIHTFMTGNMLHDACQNEEYKAYAYVMGATDMTTLMAARVDERLVRPCISTSIMTSQAVDVACNYLQEHPEERHWSASRSVWVALSEAFPCPTD